MNISRTKIDKMLAAARSLHLSGVGIVVNRPGCYSGTLVSSRLEAAGCVWKRGGPPRRRIDRVTIHHATHLGKNILTYDPIHTSEKRTEFKRKHEGFLTLHKDEYAVFRLDNFEEV